MVTLAEIEAELAKNDTADRISSVAAFRELIWVLDIPPDFVGWLDDALGVTLELLPIAKSFDQDNKSVWENWESTILEVQTILQTYPLV